MRTSGTRHTVTKLSVNNFRSTGVSLGCPSVFSCMNLFSTTLGIRDTNRGGDPICRSVSGGLTIRFSGTPGLC